MPLIPSQVDPNPTALGLRGDSFLTSVFAGQSFFPAFYTRGHKLSTARPFSTRHVGSSVKLPAFDESILGSGDFTVLSGGTFYPDGQVPNHDYFGSSSISSGSFHDAPNSGRPFALPLSSAPNSDDPFADFKDFADLTAGIDSDFSHHEAVYATTNGTKVKHEPRNILEQLQMIDEEKQEQAEVAASKPIKDTKMSKFKLKLLSSKITKSPKTKEKKLKKISSSTSDYLDPLEAES